MRHDINAGPPSQAMNEPAPDTAGAPAPPSIFAWPRTHLHQAFLLAASIIILMGALFLLGRGWRVEAPADNQAQPPSGQAPTTPQSSGNPWQYLEIAKAEYTPPAGPQDDLIWRDEGPEPPKLSSFARAMRSYERGEYALAERRLERVLETDPTHAEAHFYRGVSLLLTGRPTDALAPLHAATRHGQGRLREDAHWYLALAYLKAGGPQQAVKHLDVVVQTSNRRRAEASQLRQQVIDTESLDH
jgi:tetratricopeptide (TPR) repeat protein